MLVFIVWSRPSNFGLLTLSAGFSFRYNTIQPYATMRTPEAIRFYNSDAWHQCREAYLIKTNHLCERCLAKGIYEPAYIVHHKIYLDEQNFGDPDVMLSFDNLLAVCKSCHNEIHFGKKQDRRWKFIEGKLVTK